MRLNEAPQDIAKATAPLTNDSHEDRRIADRVMAILAKAVEVGMPEVIKSTMFWRDVLECFDERGLDVDTSAQARAAVAGFHAGFASAYERSFTQSLNQLMEQGYVAYNGDGEVRPHGEGDEICGEPQGRALTRGVI